MFFCLNFHWQVTIPKFFDIFGLHQLDMNFSMKKGDNWPNLISSKDSIIMNLVKSVSFSESESDKYLFDFLKEATMIGV